MQGDGEGGCWEGAGDSAEAGADVFDAMCFFEGESGDGGGEEDDGDECAGEARGEAADEENQEQADESNAEGEGVDGCGGANVGDPLGDEISGDGGGEFQAEEIGHLC